MAFKMAPRSVESLSIHSMAQIIVVFTLNPCKCPSQTPCWSHRTSASWRVLKLWQEARKQGRAHCEKQLRHHLKNNLR